MSVEGGFSRQDERLFGADAVRVPDRFDMTLGREERHQACFHLSLALLDRAHVPSNALLRLRESDTRRRALVVPPTRRDRRFYSHPAAVEQRERVPPLPDLPRRDYDSSPPVRVVVVVVVDPEEQSERQDGQHNDPDDDGKVCQRDRREPARVPVKKKYTVLQSISCPSPPRCSICSEKGKKNLRSFTVPFLGDRDGQNGDPAIDPDAVVDLVRPDRAKVLATADGADRRTVQRLGDGRTSPVRVDGDLDELVATEVVPVRDDHVVLCQVVLFRNREEPRATTRACHLFIISLLLFWGQFHPRVWRKTLRTRNGKRDALEFHSGERCESDSHPACSRCTCQR